MASKTWMDRLAGGLRGFAGADYINAYNDQQKAAQQKASQEAFNNWVMGGGGVGGAPTAGIGGSPMVSPNMNNNSQFIAVPNAQGSFDLQPNPIYKAQIAGQAKAGEAQKKSIGNFGRVASAVKLFSDYYANALDEGGVGGLLAREKGKFVTQQLGGSLGEQMTGTGKLFGQRAELSLSMVPILTNQNRFMTSIMDYINQSLPQGHEGAKMAEGKLEQTLINQFTTTKVLTRLGYNPDNPDEVSKIDNMSDEEAGGLATKVIGMAKVYKLSNKEEEEFEEIKKDVLGSLINYKPKTGKKSFKNLWE